MGLALQKTLSLILLIGIGILLKKKIRTPEQVRGIKILILSIALPATIFIALLKIEIKPGLLFLPIMALGVNLLLFLGAKIMLKILSIDLATAKGRSLLLLVPSLAPGLSCFPFLTEYFGEESLAIAALADVGNKFFVLILLYLLAMHWYYQLLNNRTSTKQKTNNRIKELLWSLLREPINLVIIVAISMLCFGFNLASLPAFLQDSVGRMSALMTPMVLIFIGLAVNIRKGDLLLILQVLFWRAGFAFLVSALLLMILPPAVGAATLLVAVVFPQSACSFWPFVHMTAIRSLEDKKAFRTFDMELGLNLLAFSLPFSTLIILAICSFSPFFTEPTLPLTLGLVLLTVSLLPMLIGRVSNWKVRQMHTLQQEERA